MTEAISEEPFTALTLNLRPIMGLTDEQLYLVCQGNRELCFGRTVHGELLVMAPTRGEAWRRNSTLTRRLANWAECGRTGLTFHSSTGFALRNSVGSSRWDAITLEQKQRFVPSCPDFVIELNSGTDTQRSLQDKFQEYRQNGTRLGWHIDPHQRRVYFFPTHLLNLWRMLNP